jgi:nitrate/nitrite transporter NarK
MQEAWKSLRYWPRRRWSVAAIWAISTVVVVGIPTVLIPTPIFGRQIPVTWWAWPVLIATAVLAGLLGATYVRSEAPVERPSSMGFAGGVLAYFAVGCPVCNKIALIALGYTGALQWFAPIQPFLGIIGIALLIYALHRRLVGEISCTV